MSSAYEILGLHVTATDVQIRDAYRQLAKSHHPDRLGNSPVAHERFISIVAAYEILSDAERRAVYDRDPTGMLEGELAIRRREAQKRRRRGRLKKLYRT